MNNLEITSLVVILTTLIKVIYDIFISSFFFERDLDNDTEMYAAVKSKKTKDNIITFIVLCIITSASILSLRESMMTNEVTRIEFIELANRVQLLDDRVKALENPLDPTGPGGGPKGGPPAKLSEIREDLYEKLNAMQSNFVTKVEFNKIIKIVAELKNPPVSRKQQIDINKGIIAVPIATGKTSDASG